MDKASINVFGISVSFALESSVRRTIYVLERIKEKYPSDFDRITLRVKSIVGLPEQDDGTLGEFHRDVDPNCDDDEDDVMGTIDIVESLPVCSFVLTLAHELGHACSTEDEISEANSPEDEWGSELTADRYAVKWGFGRYLAEARKTRDPLHHLGGPGETVEVNRRVFRITDDLRFEELSLFEISSLGGS